MSNLFSRVLRSFSLSSQKPIVVVSGLPRSGTSLMMKMLEAGGIPPLTDNLRIADDDNPKGYYEFERVKQLPKGDVAWLPDARGKSVKVISALLQHLPANYSYKILFMERTLEEVLASQRKMLVHRAENSGSQDAAAMDDAQMTAIFHAHLNETRHWLSQQGNIDTLYVHYSKLMRNPQPDINRINQFLQGTLAQSLNTSTMMQVIDPSLYRNRQG